ncbi:MAG: OmpH family outer membrane protein [Luteimonas sp.]|nr:OmpH family outer membrane protein [Luteimonas sp.]
MFLLLGGFAINEGYAYVRSSFVDPDAYLKKIEAKQDASFQALQESLGRLTGSLDGADKAVVREVQAAATEIKNANRGLMQQLALAKRENERLAQLAGQQAGVRGGYDFILSSNTGLVLDEGVILGVTGIGAQTVFANLSTPDTPNKAARLRSGQSLAYRNAEGRSCSVTVLSVQQGASASFATHCS